MTWGISGPDFLKFYLGLAVVLLLVNIAVHFLGQVNRPKELGPLDGWQLAVLGNQKMTLLGSALAELTSAGSFDPEGRFIGYPRAGTNLSPGAQVLLQQLATSDGKVDPAAFHAAVAPAVHDTRKELRAEGYLPPGWVAVVRWPLYALAAAWTLLGVARLVAGLSAGRPVGYLIAALIFGTILLYLSVPAGSHLTAPARAAIARMRSEFKAYDPRQGGNWSPDPRLSALTVALFGVGALYAAAPHVTSMVGELTPTMLASMSGLTVPTGGGGGSSCGSSGSSCSSGSSSSCGGGCGGGGCGG